jgi:hypothetical protein
MLTMQPDLALAIGPDDTDKPLAILEGVFRCHRARYTSGDWGVQMFEHGIDLRDGNAARYGDVGLPSGCV